MKVRIAGAGASVPPTVIANDRLLRMFPGPRKNPWNAARFEQKTGIRERRFFFDLDDRTGRAAIPEGYGEPPGPAAILAERALIEALERAGVDPAGLDGLVYGTCTPDLLHFGSDAQMLHHRLGMRSDATVLQVDVGCGGAAFCLQWAKELLLGGHRERIAVVLTHTMSLLYDPTVYAGAIQFDDSEVESFLSPLLFGDGAGAVVLEVVGDDSASEMASSLTVNEFYEIARVSGGGNLRPAGLPGTALADHAFYVIGKRVAEAYAPVLKKAIDHAVAAARISLADVTSVLVHQANLRLIEKLRDALGIAPERMPANVDRYGNTSAASVLILLAEEVRAGRLVLGSGDPVVLATIGANFQYGAHVIRL
ncbi:3-oxoacyl-ACP synthase III family protein [Nocardia asiatica]|uniref:3-oxoacyl-ACP synthase III family protein n=1 Tax=Nocardia asiatica TaxID=209252 RepID=UPI002455920F|nr:3-oxoacyl-[acyl-carrier-protein] synthase III C-terminal domain-containing protein [Nocardia asiatica]